MTASNKPVHEVTFVSYPKLLFTWPLLLAGLLFWPFTPPMNPADTTATQPTAVQVADAADETGEAEAAAPPPAERATSGWLEVFGWIYIWLIVIVLLGMGVDIERNVAVVWIVFFGAVWILGVWLQDVKGFTLFGDIFRWLANLDVQYDRSFGLVLSIILALPFSVMLVYARINDRWRITHNEFEHYSLGRMDDSLGRGAKTIRTAFPDVFELLLGLAGTLIVYNATGTKELRRIPHVMFLPFVRKRLNKILESTSITAAQYEDEEEDSDDEEI